MSGRLLRYRMPEESILGREVWLAPVLFVGCVALAAVMIVKGAQQVPQLAAKLLLLGTKSQELRIAGESLLGLVAALSLAEQARRWDSKKPALPLLLRVNRAAAYGMAATLGFVCMKIAGDDALLSRLLVDEGAQGTVLGLAFASALLSYVVVLHPFRTPLARRLASYQEQVRGQARSYDLTIGIQRTDDWEHAATGRKEWVVWPEEGLFGNMLAVGQIGSGKTSQLADPIALQLLSKFAGDRDRQPSIVVLDLKGNQTPRYHGWARSFGRDQDFRVLRPDLVDTIPASSYVSFNVLSGWQDTDLLAIEFQEALESTKDRPSPDYFQMVQKEFLVHCLRVVSAAKGSAPDLVDVRNFAASTEDRLATLQSLPARVEPGVAASRDYFLNEFGKLDPKDQAGLLRGLSSQLTLLTNRSVQEAFCSTAQGREPFRGWTEEVLNRPGIVVFSCPPALFTDGLSRLLGILVLKNFQQAMLKRCDAAFAGNRQRPVILLVDEAHAFLNKKLGDFMAVSRECRVSTMLLTQSISQVPHEYRGILQSNTRSKLVLSVSDETARVFSESLGDTVEVQESMSFSENLSGVTSSPLVQSSAGRSRGLAANRSFSERERRRFSAHAIQHLGQFHAVAHVYDGVRQRESRIIETCPWFRLPYYLLDLRKHPNVACKDGRLHAYRRVGESLVCSSCGKELKTSWEILDLLTAKGRLERGENDRGEST